MKQQHQLSTIALLQARLDRGEDYFDLFLPLGLSCLPHLAAGQTLQPQDLQGKLEELFGLRVSNDSCRLLLNKAVRKAALKKEGGAYLVVDGFDFQPYDYQAAWKSAQDRYQGLAIRHAEYLKDEYDEEIEESEALDRIIAFLESQQVPILLDANLDESLDRVGRAGGAQRRTARFLLTICEEDPAARLMVGGLLQGIVMKQALVLEKVTGPATRLRKLDVYFDSNVLRAALGYEGETLRTATLSFLDLLREAGARLFAFDPTIRELLGILSLYEARLGTDSGRRTLRPSAMTRHFLHRAYRPSDMAREKGLLRNRVRSELGLEIRDVPDHVAEYTDDEKSLAEALKDERSGRDPLKEPRVLHDVDCVAAIQTIRRGRTSSKIDESRAVFVTRAPDVFRNVRDWWESQGYSGIPPIVHQWWLSSVLWLKVRGAASSVRDLPTSSLVSLCETALRPDARMWGAFLERLDVLVKDEQLSSDEAVAMLCSSLADSLLSRAQDDIGDDEEPDAACAQEAIDRVQASYRQEAAHNEALWHAERDKRLSLVARMDATVSKVARWAALALFIAALVLLVLVIIGGGGYLGLGGVVSGLAAGGLILVTVANLVWGHNLSDQIGRFDRWLANRLRSLLEIER